MGQRQPNVVYILSDEHRGQALGHAGETILRTPVLDQLAAEGVSFVNAFANCPICTPSRGTIFSGRQAHSGPVQGFFDNYKVASPSIATHLRQYGYHTAYFGKWHMGVVRDQYPQAVRDHPELFRGESARTPERHRAGFQDWFGFENLNQHFASYYYEGHNENPTTLGSYETDGLTDLAIRYLQGYDRREPLFLTLSVTPPHFPLTVPQEWNRFSAETVPLRPNVAQNDRAETARQLAVYYAMIENLDANIGRLMRTLQQTPGFEDTLIVYFSDHGELMGSHGRSCRKEFPYEEAIRIPAIFHNPARIPAQGVRSELFSLVDLFSTTCAIIDVPVPAYCQGTDFSPALRGEEFAGPEDVLLEMVANPRWDLSFYDWRAIRTERWKYAFYETGEEELYDLATDPYEQKNLALGNPGQRQMMFDLLLRRLQETREPFFDVIMQHGKNMNSPDVDVSNPCRGEAHPGLDS